MTRIVEKRTYTDQDRRELEQLKDLVHGRLRQQRAVSELIWDTGNAMYRADQRGLWPMDVDTAAWIAQRGKGKKGKKRKADSPTREMWASLVFKMSDRQARKLFNIGEHLTREEVEGTGLCTDRLEQVSLSPVEIRDLIRDLGVEGLSARALSAGRRAALPYLAANDVKGAPTEAEQVARRTDRREEREDWKQAPGQGSDPPDGPEKQEGEGPDVAMACVVASELLEEVEEMGRPEDLDHLTRLAEITARLAERVRLAVERAQGGVKAEDRKEASGPAPARAAAPTYARPAAGVPISFAPLLAAIRALSVTEREMLEIGLSRVVAGKPISEVEEMLHPVYEQLLHNGVPRELAEGWMSLLTDGEREPRGLFALWFGEKMGALRLRLSLARLRGQDLPSALRRQVDVLLGDESACAGVGAGGRSRRDGETEHPPTQEAQA